jgi:hypothetical protein
LNLAPLAAGAAVSIIISEALRAAAFSHLRAKRPALGRLPASVHSLADGTRKPNENADAVIRHYKAINDELDSQLAVALALSGSLGANSSSIAGCLSMPSGSAGSNKPGSWRGGGHDAGSSRSPISKPSLPKPKALAWSPG